MLVKVLLCYFFFVFSFWFHTIHCVAVYNITSSAPLLENDTLVSSNQTFELVFFTSGGAGNLYVGIWYKNISPTKIVWVANREKAVMSAEEAASLRIGSDGKLQLVDGHGNEAWSTNVTVNPNNSLVELLDTGNLVLRDRNSGNIMWESFDHPCHVVLPGMKVGISVRTEEKNYLVSWKSNNDPAPGDFVIGITPEVPPQAMGWKRSLPYWRGGQWDKAKFIGIDDMDGTYTSIYRLHQDPEEGTYFSIVEDPQFTHLTMFLSPNGTLKLIFWKNNTNEWQTLWEAPLGLCESYGACGPFGNCRASNPPICSCLSGFVPKSYEEWNRGNWTGGCIRQRALNCQKSTNTSSTKNNFLKLSNAKLPDSANYLPDIVNDQECHSSCLDNCSCQAYSYVDSIGCMIWTEPLIDMVSFNASGKDLFIQLAQVDSGGAKLTRKLIFSFMAIPIVIIVGVVAYCLRKWRATQKSMITTTKDNMTEKERGLQQEKVLREQLNYENNSELPLFSLDSILVATENFSVAHKLGQGGYGPVYWGRLEDGRDVAVKRLSSNSVQGVEEFKNEIVLISKLQHRNLIKLMGCCIEGEEKILIYEFLPNKSLDTFLFDLTRKSELNWDKRFNIIEGIAKGLTYLHSESSLRVIHRDLKASNILLDQKLNPKISDFGLARMFQDTQVLVNTHKVVGTFGYMSPEYAMGGIFSEKLDVYSFGVLVLEILAGKKNSLFQKREENLNLISYAWQLWSQGRELELVDETLVGHSSPLEVTKCIHIALLCVQDHTNDRPNMSTVVLMLCGDSELPQPKQPTFTSQSWSDNDINSHEENPSSLNTVTNSVIEGR